jgi:SAM-dependent methyltransferase
MTAPKTLRRALRYIPGAIELKRWLAPPPPPPPPPAHMAAGLEGYWAEPQPIETEVDAATLAALFARTQAQWMRLGETEPHWSVLTHESFRAERLDEAARAAFYATGEAAAGLVQRLAARAGAAAPGGVCLELGCGVGRVTAPLAARFERVVGVDISRGNLALAERRLAEAGIANGELRLLESVAAVADLPACDLLFSVIVLQHNSPPVQAFMLDQLLPKVRPGGAALFQTPTNVPGYRFSAADYLASPDAEMEMHALPQATVLGLLRRHGLQVQEVLMDPWTGGYGSNTFFATRPA